MLINVDYCFWLRASNAIVCSVKVGKEMNYLTRLQSSSVPTGIEGLIFSYGEIKLLLKFTPAELCITFKKDEFRRMRGAH